MSQADRDAYPEQWMILHHEEGGYRHYLGGRPVHAGDQLRLWNGAWVWARYESRSHGKASLYLAGDRVLDLKPGMRLRWPESWER